MRACVFVVWQRGQYARMHDRLLCMAACIVLAGADLPYNGPNLRDDTVRTHCGLQRPGRRERESVVDVRHAAHLSGTTRDGQQQRSEWHALVSAVHLLTVGILDR
jgi:hypothetical protein